MKLEKDWTWGNADETLKCPLCSSTFLESSSHIEVQEWQGATSDAEEPTLNTVYTCSACGHRFSAQDIEEKKRFKQGIHTLLVISIMIILLLIVLL